MANLSFVHIAPLELRATLNVASSWLNPDGYIFANYFEGEDEVKEMMSKWGKNKKNKVEITRQFAFHSEKLLRELYEEAGLEITQLAKEQPSPQALTRINITARRKQ